MGIGKAIKLLRTRHKVPQQVLAKNVGVTQGYLSLIEKGLREPGFDLIEKIAKTLSIPQQIIFLLACNRTAKSKRFAKPLKNITLLIDDILSAT